MTKYFIRLLLACFFVPQSSLAVPLKCGDLYQRLDLKSAIVLFENSDLGKLWDNQQLVASLKLMQSLGLQIPGNYQYRIYLQFKSKDKKGNPINQSEVLADFGDLPTQKSDDGAVWITVPYDRLPTVLSAASKPRIADAIEYFGVHDVQGDAKEAHVAVKVSERSRDVKIQNNFVDRFISGRGGQDPRLVSNISEKDSDIRTYLMQGKLLNIPKDLKVSHGFGQKYDRFIQLATANLLADIFRLNLGDNNIGNYERQIIRPQFLFQNITSVGIYVTGIKKSPSSDIPYSMSVEIEVEGTVESADHLSKQIVTANINFEGTALHQPHVQILRYNFK